MLKLARFLRLLTTSWANWTVRIMLKMLTFKEFLCMLRFSLLTWTLVNHCPVFLSTCELPILLECTGMCYGIQRKQNWLRSECLCLCGGISEEGNHAADGWNSTLLREIQPTDKDGVTTLDTIFPGYYSGRDTHIRLSVIRKVTSQPNGRTILYPRRPAIL